MKIHLSKRESTNDSNQAITEVLKLFNDLKECPSASEKCKSGKIKQVK